MVPSGLLETAGRWSRLTAGPAIANTAASLLTLAGTALLYRTLAADDVGLLALYFSLLEVSSTIATLGFTTVVTRRYSRPQKAERDWPVDLAITAALSLPLSILTSLAARLLYDLPFYLAAALAAVTALIVVHHVAVFMLNARRHYLSSGLLLRLPNALLILAALLILLAPALASLQWVIPLHAAASVLSLLIALRLLWSRVERGPLRVSWQQRKDGFVFLANSGSAMLASEGPIVLAGVLVEPAVLATFAAMAILLRGYKLVSGILGMVMTPELVHSQRSDIRRLFLGVSLVAALSFAGPLLLAPPVLDWIYGGRFQAGLSLIPLIALTGALNLFGVLPRSDLLGGASQTIINRYVLLQLLASAVGTLASAFFIAAYGATGIATAFVLVAVLRIVVTFISWRHMPRSGTEAG